MSELPSTPLQTETAIQIGLMVRAAGYKLEISPRANGADLAAARHGTVWATFHVDVDAKRPLLLRVGATVWGGARVGTGAAVGWDAAPDERLKAFVKDRLEFACKRGREESPDHCDECPNPRHRGHLS